MSLAETRANSFSLIPARRCVFIDRPPWHAIYPRCANRRWTLIFGFTHCPEICHYARGAGGSKLQLVDTEANDLQIVMLTKIDPARDTPARLADYVPYFHPDFGRDGKFADILGSRSSQCAVSQGKRADGGYQMEHSANVMLMNQHDDYHGFFAHPRHTQNAGNLTLYPIRGALTPWLTG